MSEVLASSLDYETTLASVARRAVPQFADWWAVHVKREDGTIQQLVLTHVDPAKVELARELQRRYFEDPQVPYSVVVPLIAPAETFGAVMFVSADSGGHYGPADLALAQDLAHRAALAVDNARLYHKAQSLNEELDQRVAQRTAELANSYYGDAPRRDQRHHQARGRRDPNRSRDRARAASRHTGSTGVASGPRMADS